MSKNLSFFAKRHATRVIYRLTVQTCQTVSRLNSHRLTRHRQDRLVLSGGRCELGIRLHSENLYDVTEKKKWLDFLFICEPQNDECNSSTL